MTTILKRYPSSSLLFTINRGPTVMAKYLQPPLKVVNIHYLKFLENGGRGTGDVCCDIVKGGRIIGRIAVKKSIFRGRGSFFQIPAKSFMIDHP